MTTLNNREELIRAAAQRLLDDSSYYFELAREEAEAMSDNELRTLTEPSSAPRVTLGELLAHHKTNAYAYYEERLDVKNFCEREGLPEDAADRLFKLIRYIHPKA